MIDGWEAVWAAEVGIAIEGRNWRGRQVAIVANHSVRSRL